MTTKLTGKPAQILHFARIGSLLLVVLAVAISAVASSSRADSPAKQEKHARKMEKHLARYRTGTLIQVDFRDSSVAMGSLSQVSDATFQMVDADNNKLQTYRYSDVSGVKQAKEYIGAGSEPGHRVRRWVPILAGALFAGGGAAAYETLR